MCIFTFNLCHLVWYRNHTISGLSNLRNGEGLLCEFPCQQWHLKCIWYNTLITSPRWQEGNTTCGEFIGVCGGSQSGPPRAQTPVIIDEVLKVCVWSYYFIVQCVSVMTNLHVVAVASSSQSQTYSSAFQKGWPCKTLQWWCLNNIFVPLSGLKTQASLNLQATVAIMCSVSSLLLGPVHTV